MSTSSIPLSLSREAQILLDLVTQHPETLVELARTAPAQLAPLALLLGPWQLAESWQAPGEDAGAWGERWVRKHPVSGQVELEAEIDVPEHGEPTLWWRWGFWGLDRERVEYRDIEDFPELLEIADEDARKQGWVLL
jgi:hypothetical protein